MAVLVSLLAACFEDPAIERVSIRLVEDDYAEVADEITFAEQGEQKKALIERLNALRDEYLRQQDPWSRAFSAIGPEFEKLEWEKNEGRLHRIRHSAWTKTATLDRLFTQQGIALTVLDDPEWQEPSIYPGTKKRGTREQQQRVSSAFGQWAEGVASYVDAMRAVYDYIDANPDRAVTCLRPLFSDVLSESDREPREEPTATENDLIKRARESMNRVSDVVKVPPEEAYSLNELSLLVFDPFGYDLSVTCGGEILSEAGFSARQQRTVTHQRRNLWSAFEGLEGKWLSPDPLLMAVRRDRSGDHSTVPLQQIVEQKRFAARAIAGAEARAALEKELRPPEALRVRCARLSTEPGKAGL